MGKDDHWHFHPDSPTIPVRIYDTRPRDDDGSFSFLDEDGRRWFICEDRQIDCVCSGRGCDCCDGTGRYWCEHIEWTKLRCVYCSAPVKWLWES